MGMADINPENISDWAKTYTMKLADESYWGKQGYEIKINGGKLRHATEEEITAHKNAQEVAQEANKKAKALETLGLTSEDIEKIKKLPNEIEWTDGHCLI